jgi:hypothetical protein
MTDQPKQQKPRVEPLDLKKETLADLTEQEAEEVKGGAADVGRATFRCDTKVGCATQMDCGRVPV